MNYFERIIELFTTRDVSRYGRQAFYRWLSDEEHAPEKNRALEKLWSSTTAAASPGARRSLHSVKEKAGIPIRKKTIPRLRIWQTAVAILLIACLSSLYLYFVDSNRTTPDLVEQYIPVAETARITLPDGSVVHLNSQSVLLYPEQFTAKNRSVYLTGEANFKVKPDQKRPFIVKSTDFQVTVLGTEFNVCAYPGDSLLRATVLSGKVKVNYDNLQFETVLLPNQQLTYNKYTGRYMMDNPDVIDVTAWQRGELVFNGATLGEVITVLERKYPYTFSYSLSRLKEDKYNFCFHNKAELSEVMEIIVQVAGDLQYKIEGNTCVIY